MVFGEITTKAQVDYEKVVRNAIKAIGTTVLVLGFADPKPLGRAWWTGPPPRGNRIGWRSF